MTLTNILVAINIIAYLWEVATGGPNVDHSVLYGPAVSAGQWWRIFTAAFLHANFLHITFNMVALYQVGNIVEALYGKVRFSALYLVSIVGSGLSVITFNYAVPTLGASGAIFGLFGALVAVGLRMGQRGRGLIGQVLPIIVINLIFTYSVPGISAAAHVGGLLTGFIAGLVLYMVPVRRRTPEYAYAFDPAREPAATIEQPPPPQAPE